MSTAKGFLGTNGEDQWAVQGECGDGGTSNVCKPRDEYVIPLKVLRPNVCARIEQSRRNTGIWGDRHFSGTLPQGAGNTGQRKIFESRHPAGGLWRDMIDMKGRFLPYL